MKLDYHVSIGLESPEMRRLNYDLLFTYKIVFGLVSDAATNMFIR